jgi:hypothetical protein
MQIAESGTFWQMLTPQGLFLPINSGSKSAEPA